MNKKMNVSQKEKLFHPNYTFVGDISKFLKGYPKRSQHLEKYADKNRNCKNLNSRFIKNGYMYLLRGAKNGQETGFYSREYARKNTIESLKLDPNKVAYAQNINGDTPFISATTDLNVAASFSNKEKIYLLKIPVEDVYTFFSDETLDEKEYMIPDFVSEEEIVRSFRYDKFRQIYNYLTEQVGLPILPEDLGQTEETLQSPDKSAIEMQMKFNNACGFLDDTLKAFQDVLLDVRLEESKKEDCKRQIAVLTDIHALKEPTEAILKDIEKRGITEIYSLGDNIGLGPNPKEVLDLLKEYGVQSLAGNYEEMITLGPKPFLSYLSRQKMRDAEWTTSKLTAEQIREIGNYPHFLDLKIGKQHIGLCHFANDVRCDFLKNNCLDYRNNLLYGYPGYKQFSYTNSKDQMLEFAYRLGMNIELLRDLPTASEMLKFIRKYVEENLNKLTRKPELYGYLSSIEDPLFVRDGKLLTVSDYSMIVQGHVHFSLEETSPYGKINTVRGAGIGYGEEGPSKAQYLLLKQTEKEIESEIVNVEYDREKMENSIYSSDNENPLILQYTNLPYFRS